MTKTNIILSFCIVILLLVIYHQKTVIDGYKVDYEYFDSRVNEYNTRINEINQLIEDISKKEFIIDTIQNNLQKENDFLLTATPDQVFAKYYPNEMNIGGN